MKWAEQPGLPVVKTALSFAERFNSVSHEHLFAGFVLSVCRQVSSPCQQWRGLLAFFIIIDVI